MDCSQSVPESCQTQVVSIHGPPPGTPHPQCTRILTVAADGSAFLLDLEHQYCVAALSGCPSVCTAAPSVSWLSQSGYIVAFFAPTPQGENHLPTVDLIAIEILPSTLLASQLADCNSNAAATKPYCSMVSFVAISSHNFCSSKYVYASVLVVAYVDSTSGTGHGDLSFVVTMRCSCSTVDDCIPSR